MIARWLLALGVALGAIGLSMVGERPTAGQPAPAVEAPARAKLRFTKHAERRLRERRVSRESVERLVASTKPFPYLHDGRMEQGYYDEPSKLFVATADGAVITVITGATPRYVDKLRRTVRSK